MLCGQEIVPYEDTLALEGAFDYGDYQLEVNGYRLDFSYQEPPVLERGAIEQPEGDEKLAFIERVAVLAQPGNVTLLLEGAHLDGCEVPVQAELLPGDATLFVRAFRVLPADILCPAMITPYTAAIPIDDPGQMLLFHVSINGFRISLEGLLFTRVDHVIESVEPRVLESFPPRVELQVRGYQIDGCLYPVEVRQTRADNFIMVEIYRELPPNVRCPRATLEYETTITLEGTFERGTYTLLINGVEMELAV